MDFTPKIVQDHFKSLINVNLYEYSTILLASTLDVESEMQASRNEICSLLFIFIFLRILVPISHIPVINDLAKIAFYNSIKWGTN